MPFPMKVVEVQDGSNNLWTDRVLVGIQVGVANEAGSGSDSVTVAVGFENLPCNASGVGTYGVLVTPSQACAVSVSDKTWEGFNVTLTPLSGTLAAGTFDVFVFG
jgi:hypothetical protein